MRVPLKHIPKAPPTNTVTLAVGFQHGNLGAGNTNIQTEAVNVAAQGRQAVQSQTRAEVAGRALGVDLQTRKPEF